MTTNDCCICYESIQYSATTPCGHVFCTGCYTQSVIRSNQCPMCRTELYQADLNVNTNNDGVYEEGHYEDEDEDDTFMSEYTQTNYDEIDDGVEVESVVDQFTRHGYDIKDAISLLITKFSKTDQKYTEEYNLDLCEKFNEIIRELRLEHIHRIGMEMEDHQAFDATVSPIREFPTDVIPEPTQLPHHVSSPVMYDISHAL